MGIGLMGWVEEALLCVCTMTSRNGIPNRPLESWSYRVNLPVNLYFMCVYWCFVRFSLTFFGFHPIHGEIECEDETSGVERNEEFRFSVLQKTVPSHTLIESDSSPASTLLILPCRFPQPVVSVTAALSTYRPCVPALALRIGFISFVFYVSVQVLHLHVNPLTSLHLPPHSLKRCYNEPKIQDSYSMPFSRRRSVSFPPSGRPYEYLILHSFFGYAAFGLYTFEG